MTFKELLQKIRGKEKEDGESLKEAIRNLDRQTRAEEIVSERRTSANERELARYYKEDREESIKEQLEDMRKKRLRDINFGHNPLSTKNVIYSDFEILKGKKLFVNKGNMFSNQKNIFAPKRKFRK